MNISLSKFESAIYVSIVTRGMTTNGLIPAEWWICVNISVRKEYSLQR